MSPWYKSLLEKSFFSMGIFFPPLPQIDGEKMSPGCRVPPIVMYERKDARWALKDKHT